MTVSERVERLAGNAHLTLVARLAMFLTPILVTVGLFILGQYLGGQAKAMSDAGERLVEVEKAAAELDKRAALLESAILQIRDTSTQTLMRVDRLQESIATLSSSVAALDATLTAERR